ncbi:MAG: hypothetical protein IJX27_03380 [Clostridia bacterium]|nr:hypothetical protein [Clostridia bacterium]
MNDDLLMNIHVDDIEKRLFVSRPKENKSGAFSPCNMSPDDIDYEMSQGKDKRILEICGMNQESLEYFVDKYGQTYESLYFFKCQLISDFSPLAKLKNLKAVRIYWNIRSGGLWDMSENESLTHLVISDSKIITRNLKLLKTGKNLKYVKLMGGMFEKYPLNDLLVFENMPSLESLSLYDIKLGDRNTAFLKTLPKLTEFNFDAGMFTTEEIAYMCARYPHIHGRALCAYNEADATLNDVRVCGYRKPGLDLPAGQKRLDKYVAAFNALVEKYKTEELE